MPRLTRTQKYADLRERIANDAETSLNTNELAKYADRLSNIQGFANNNVESATPVEETITDTDDNRGTPLIYDDVKTEEVVEARPVEESESFTFEQPVQEPVEEIQPEPTYFEQPVQEEQVEEIVENVEPIEEVVETEQAIEQALETVEEVETQEETQEEEKNVLDELFGDINDAYEKLLESQEEIKSDNTDIINDIFKDEPIEETVVGKLEEEVEIKEPTLEEILASVNNVKFEDITVEEPVVQTVSFDDVPVIDNDEIVEDYVEEEPIDQPIEETVEEVQEEVEQEVETVEETPVVEDTYEEPTVIEEPEIFENPAVDIEEVEEIVEDTIEETIEEQPSITEEEVEVYEQPEEIEEVLDDVVELEPEPVIEEVQEAVEQPAEEAAEFVEPIVEPVVQTNDVNIAIDDFTELSNSIIDEIRHSNDNEAEFAETPVESDDDEFSNTVSMEISKIMDNLSTLELQLENEETKVAEPVEEVKKVLTETSTDGVEIKNIKEYENEIANTISDTIPFIVDNNNDYDSEEEEEGSNVILNVILIVLIIVLIAVLALIVYYILKTKRIL